MKNIVIIYSNSLQLPVIRNRLKPFIDCILPNDLKIIIICPNGQLNSDFNSDKITIIEVDKSNKYAKSNNFFKRSYRELKLSKALLIEAKNVKTDGYLISIPSMFLAFIAPIYLTKNKVFLDIRDLSWEYLSSSRLIHRLSKIIFRNIFKNTLNFYEFVSVTNLHELAYINRFWKGKQPAFLVPNGITNDQFNKLKIVKASTNKELTVSYIGNIGLAQNLETLIIAAKELPAIKFKIVGSGVEESKIKDLIKEHFLTNVELTGPLPWEDVISIYNDSDILYAQLSPEFSGAMPSKLYEYLATGKYIVYGGEGQAAMQLMQFENCTIIPPCDHKLLIEAIKQIDAYKDVIKQSRKNQEKIKEHYIREETAKYFIDKIVESINT